MRLGTRRALLEIQAPGHISPRVINYKIKTLGIEMPKGRRPMAAPQG